MAVAAWAASTAFSLGDVRRATADQVTGLFFKCTTAGTSAGSEPDWPTDIGSTVADNNVVWTAISSVYEELSKLAPSAIIELFEVRLSNDLHGSNDIYRFHNGCNADIDGNIVWDGNQYSRQPVEASGFEYSATGQLPRPTLTIANLDNTITALLVVVNTTTTGNDLTGAEVRRIRTLKKFLDGESAADPNAQWPMEIWEIDRKSSENRVAVEFELASKLDRPGDKIPRRQMIGNICQWAYRSGECGYTGSNYWDVNDNVESSLANDRCGKRVSSCKLRFGANNALPFGSFPSAGRQN
ncbi:phage minor tail protein L [Candidatus Poribacteria bacterium]|nr:phage minor tail protein L [Candidatus Poribacteria bacterium]